VLKKRIRNYKTRGIAKPANQSFEAMAAKRHQLYQKYTDIQIDTVGSNVEKVVELILSKLD
jgi:shikimate kinase